MARPKLTRHAEHATRSSLTQLALELYLGDGLDAVSFRKLAERAQVSHTYPYRFFENKEALLTAIRVLCSKRFSDFLRSHDEPDASPLKRVRAVTTHVVRFAREHPAEYSLLFTLDQPPPDRFDELLDIRQSLIDFVTDIAAQAVAAGQASGNPQELAQLIWAGVHGLISLDLAKQLVHGQSIDTLLGPMVDRLLSGGAR